MTVPNKPKLGLGWLRNFFRCMHISNTYIEELMELLMKKVSKGGKLMCRTMMVRQLKLLRAKHFINSQSSNLSCGIVIKIVNIYAHNDATTKSSFSLVLFCMFLQS